GWGEGNVVAAFLIKAGASIIDSIPILFAVGVAYGMSKGKDGASALSGLVAFLVITTLLAPETVALFQGIDPENTNAAFAKVDNAFIGILSGLI
ncbi:PTS transporter subunit EIIC, partial [Microvirga sp. 3-52]|nr:PTS transporter subunit EIIC [Microvirga sp. 3-52]